MLVSSIGQNDLVTNRCGSSPILAKRYNFTYTSIVIKEKYSRGRRGAPAKGIGRETGARVQIPPSPPLNLKIWSSGVVV